MRNRWWAAPDAAAVALLAACGSSAGTSGGAANSPAPAASSGGGGQSGSTNSTSASGIKTARTKLGTILVTAQGYTIYLFAIDKPNKSVCFGSCAQFWPPLKHPTAASGANLPGKFGTIKRAGGGTQATYDGHPLYLFQEDTSPGQVRGNAINTSGGLWYAITPAGSKPAATAASKSGSSSGGSSGGYGY